MYEGEGEHCAQDLSLRMGEFCFLRLGSRHPSPGIEKNVKQLVPIFQQETDLLLYAVKYRRLLFSDVIGGHVARLHPSVLYAPPVFSIHLLFFLKLNIILYPLLYTIKYKTI